MQDAAELREKTLSRVRDLSAEKLKLLDEFIDELQVTATPYELSAEELEISNDASADVAAGHYATDAEVAHAFRHVSK